MKLIHRLSIILIITAGLFLSGCNAAKKGQCGCPNRKGFVGY